MGPTSKQPLGTGTNAQSDRIVTQAGQHDLRRLIVGCRVWADSSKEGLQKGEILLTRQGRSSASPAVRSQGSATPGDDDGREFYLHYLMLNKRNDEWVTADKIRIDKEVEWPVPKATKSGSNTPSRSKAQKRTEPNLVKKATTAAQRKRSQSQRARTSTPMDIDDDESPESSPGGKASIKASKAGKAAAGQAPEDDDEDGEAEDDPALSTLSKEEEIESLRHHGSMTQNVHEVARVKNIDKIHMGKHEIEAWYFSPYPIEYAHIPVLYVCESCLSFYGSAKRIERHRKKCQLMHPPGNEIYRYDGMSFFEIDGRKQKTYCRNLGLLSKAFLDHKTLYYDVDPFLFYIMCSYDNTGYHIVGYFSKEKESAENYNLACILTLPQYQRSGYGRLLIEFSYELSKKEGKYGSPEKPLSDLGLLSYRAYWAEVIVEYLMDKEDVSIDEISQRTGIIHTDVMHTCQALCILKSVKGQYMVVLTEAVLEQFEKSKKKKRRHINPLALQWKPPVFTRAQLSFGF